MNHNQWVTGSSPVAAISFVGPYRTHGGLLQK